jgi:hypothetical protein
VRAEPRGDRGPLRSLAGLGVLAEQADTLAEPHTRHVGGKVRELRFHLLAQQPSAVGVVHEPAMQRDAVSRAVARHKPGDNR